MALIHKAVTKTEIGNEQLSQSSHFNENNTKHNHNKYKNTHSLTILPSLYKVLSRGLPSSSQLYVLLLWLFAEIMSVCSTESNNRQYLIRAVNMNIFDRN